MSAVLLVVLLGAPGTLSGDEPVAIGNHGSTARSARQEVPPAAPGPAIAPDNTAPRTAELAFTGDIIPHQSVGRFAKRYAPNTDPEYNFVPMFQHVSQELQAVDVAICHLETTISHGPVTGYPRFSAPIELVEAIAETGWDGCSVASNHAFDFGTDGVTKTIQAMKQTGLAFTGTAIDEDSRSAARYDANGIRIAHLSYTYGLNGAKMPEHETWWVNLIDVDTIMSDAATARADGAEFIVVSLHWGMEYRRLPTTSQKEIAEEIAELGMVDLLIGHHAHVLQPIDRIDDLWVVYGLGNFLSNQNPKCCTASSEDGAILHIQIGDGPDGVAVWSVTFTPTWVDRSVMQVVAVADRLANPDLDQPRQTVLRQSWQRTVDAFGALGADQLGVRPKGSLP